MAVDRSLTPATPKYLLIIYQLYIMRSYTIDEASFNIPDEWSDKSVNVFSPSGDLPGDFSLVITRDSLPDEQSLGSYVDGQLEELSSTLPQFRLIRRYESTVDNLPAYNAEFTWRAEGNPEAKLMMQRQTYVTSARAVLILTATTIEKFSREYQLIMDNLISSFRIFS